MRLISSIVLLLATALSVSAQSPQAAQITPEQAIDRAIARERAFVTTMRNYTPMVETYLQKMKEHSVLGATPSEDRYFLGRLRVEDKIGEHFFMTGDKSVAGKFSTGRAYAAELSPIGFSSMIFVDREGLDRESYEFKYVRREFLSEVRCLVYDVTPKKNAGKHRFQGRLWVEDQDFNIVRFNGTYGTFHLDSWRMNLKPGLWLPAYVYSQETDMKYGWGKHLNFKAQTRLWGYNLSVGERQEELAQVVVDPQSAAKDTAEEDQDVSPLEAQRAWERRAEDNVLLKLEQAGLLAPEGDVDKVLKTVVSNLEITNDLQFEPEVRCRVLLTTPLESTTIGHTILISRGLLDVLPDEASLAMVLAHSVGHVVKAHELDAKYAFHDKTQFADENSFRELDLRFTPEQEKEADEIGVKLMKNSPYKDKVGDTALFLAALEDFSSRVPSLASATLSNGMVQSNKVVWMSPLLAQAPKLDYENVTQIPALPLGSRIKMDPWSNQLRLVKSKPARVLSPRDKYLFEITPFSPFLSRLKPQADTGTKAAAK